MAKFVIEGMSAHAAGIQERTASTAADAMVIYAEMHRLCGKYGSVSIRVEGGKTISFGRLQKLAGNEQDHGQGA